VSGGRAEAAVLQTSDDGGAPGFLM